MGLLAQLKEDIRAADSATVLRDIGVARLGNDDRYWKEWSYAFHLHIGTATKVFPLILNPTSIRTRHPFAVEANPAQEGGVVAEENGVIIGDLSIQGHTGVRPRSHPDIAPIPLSGQAHFLYLKDACFMEYSRQKKNPNVAGKVYMTYHNYKDGEHWVVLPGEISVERTKDKNFFYQYSISAQLISEVSNDPQRASEEDPFFAAMQDFATNAVRAVAAIEGAIEDMTGVITEVEHAISDTVGGTLADLVNVTGQVNLFLSGQKNFIDLSVRSLQTLGTSIENLATAAAAATSLPLDVAQSFLEMEDGLNRLLAYPEKFKADFNANARAFLDLVAGPTNASDLETAEAPTQTSALRASGTRAGDRTRVLGGVYDSQLSFPRYVGFREVTVLQGDTITSIAARELDDARRWIDLVFANRLSAPYISEAGLPRTIAPGGKILIPTLTTGEPGARVISPGDPVVGASQLEAMFGRDFKVVRRSDGLKDWEVDVATRQDFRSVAGLTNLEQACERYLEIERGSWIMSLNVGVDRLVGQKGTVDRIVEARGRIIEAIQRDRRIRRVKSANFTLNGDVLAVVLDLETTDSSTVRVVGRVT